MHARSTARQATTGRMPSGAIVDKNGQVLGVHQGIIHYTRGQREGLGIAVGKPLYVVTLDTERNQVVVGNKNDLYTNVLMTEKINLLVDDFPIKVFAKIRYAHPEAACAVDFFEGQRGRITFTEPQEAITPGQSIVFYYNDIVCGGGVIESSWNTDDYTTFNYII